VDTVGETNPPYAGGQRGSGRLVFVKVLQARSFWSREGQNRQQCRPKWCQISRSAFYKIPRFLSFRLIGMQGVLTFLVVRLDVGGVPQFHPERF
jgi:hypothetical protein